MTGPPLAAGAVDVHAHLAPVSMQRALERADASTAVRFSNLTAFGRALRSPAALLEQMARAGVGVSLLSVPPPAAELAGRSDAARLAGSLNDELLTTAADHPDRFRLLLALPLSDPAAAVVEVERLGRHPLVAGVCAMAHHREHRLDTPAYDDVWHAAADHDLPVLLHPAFEEPPEALQDWALPTALDAVFSTSLVAARLMLSGTLDRVPALTLVIPHLGGTLPYLAQRLVDQSGTGAAQHDVSHYLRTRVLLDTCSYHPPAFRCALDTVGVARLVLGSDHPFRGSVARAAADVAAAGLSPGETRRVLRDNALGVFRLIGDEVSHEAAPGRRSSR